VTDPARCHHSFPDPYPAPLTHIGNCRHCDTTYQEARDAMNPPTIAQLRNLTDRAATGLTADEQQRLRDGIDQLEALQAVARGYCPDCGRGDAAPTVEDWEAQRQRADRAEGRLRHLQASSEAAGILLTRTTDERDQLRAALARVNAYATRLAAQQHGVDIEADNLRRAIARDITAALDQPGPAATQATEPAGLRDLSIPHEPGPSRPPAT
jgi:hypothetical protein